MIQLTQQNFTHIGHAIFTPTITKPALKKLLTNKILKTLKQNTWVVSSQSPSSAWSNIFPLITSTTNLHIRVMCGQLTQSFYTSISHIYFANLHQLNLLCNDITTAEGLLYLNCPMLQKLGIATNNIAIISQLLSKMYFPKLSLIDCSNNKLSEITLGRFMVKTDVMTLILFTAENGVCMMQDLSVFAKLPPCEWKNFGQFLLLYKNRLPNISVDYILQPNCAKTIIKKSKANPRPQI